MSSGIRPGEDGTWVFWGSSGVAISFRKRHEALKAWHYYLKGTPELQSLVQELIEEQRVKDDND